MTAQTFSVVLIAKNEAKTLPRLVQSLDAFKVRGGEIVVVDTDSTDDTVKIAKALGCRVFEEGSRFVNIIDSDTAAKINERFVDGNEEAIVNNLDKLFNYSAARNYAASVASNDWVFMPDCDEILTQFNLSAITEAIGQSNVGRLEYEFVYAHDEFGKPVVQFRHSKFYHRSKFHWNPECIVHEILSPISVSDTTYLQPEAVKLEHWQNPKTNRGGYLPGLALDCYLHPDNDRNSHYFGRELMYKGRNKSAIREFKRHVAMKRWPAERSQSLTYIGDCCKALGQIDDALDWWHRAFLSDGSRREPLLRLAHHFFAKDDFRKVVAYVSGALALPRSGFYADNENHYKQEPHELMYTALWYLGDREGSAYHWRKALEYQPENPKYIHDAQFYGAAENNAAALAEDNSVQPHVTICIPTLSREDKLKRLLELIPQTAEYTNYDVIVEYDSFINRIGVPKLLSKMVKNAKGDFIVYLGNDCVPKPGWLRIAMASMRKNFPNMDGLIGFNDGYWHGEFATHWLASKKLLPMLDNEFFHTGYYHVGCDNELTERCRKIRKYAWCEAAQIFHDHPIQKGFKAEDRDAVYNLAYKNEFVAHDTDLLKSRSKTVGFQYRIFDKRPVVPRRIISIWLNHDPAPPEIQATLATHNMPGYEHLFITLKNCFVTPYVERCLNAQQWVKAADYLRAFYVYTEGGIYLDADIELLTDFEDLLGYPLLCARETNGFIANSVIVAKKDNGFIRNYLDLLENRPEGSVWNNGMGAWTEMMQIAVSASSADACVKPWDELHNGRIIHHKTKGPSHWTQQRV